MTGAARSPEPRGGVTLLEVMVALVILGLVVLGYLELFGGTLRLATDASEWSRAVTFAESTMEEIKIAPATVGEHEQPDQPANGYRRWVTRNDWRDGMALVTVTVTMPGGGRLEISRAFDPGDQ